MFEIFFIFLNFAFPLILIFMMISFFTGAPYLPTPHKRVKEMIELADIKRGDIIIDLGSGDGRILIEAARNGAIAHGFEINPFLAVLSKFKAVMSGVSKSVHIHVGDYRRHALPKANTVFLFGITSHMKVIEKKLIEDLEPKTKIISYTFTFPTLKIKKKTNTNIYIYSL